MKPHIHSFLEPPLKHNQDQIALKNQGLFYPQDIVWFILSQRQCLFYSHEDWKKSDSNFSDCNWTRTHNHLVRKPSLNHLAKLDSVFDWLYFTECLIYFFFFYQSPSLSSCMTFYSISSYINEFLLTNPSAVFFNWDSLHAQFNSHYKVWSYKEKKAQKD